MPDEFRQVKDRVSMLENSASMREYKVRIPQYHAVVNGTMPPDLPEHLSKGQVVEMPSPRGNRVKRQLIAETAAYPKYIRVTAENPDGAVTQELKKKADKVERWDTLAVDRLDTGKRVTNQVRDHQLASGWCVMILHCGEDPEFPWRIEVADPLTCFFPVEKGGPFRPKYLGRKFKMLVRDIQKTYSGRQRGPAKGRTLAYKDKKLRFEDLSYARPESGAEQSSEGFGGTGNDPGFAEELTFMVLYSPEKTWHVCLDGDEKGGEIVWEAPNITGGVPAIVVPGDINAIGGDGEEMLPIMYEVLTILRSKNLCRSLIVTTAAADRPEMIINCTPEQLAAMRTRGMAVPANAAEVMAGGPRMLAISGEPSNWVAAPNDALYKINEELAVELEQAANALVPSTDTQLASAATASAWDTVTGTQDRQQTPMLQHLDWAFAEIIKMLHCSLEEYEDEYTLTASADYKHGMDGGNRMKSGENVSLSAEDVTSFKFTVTVATKQETEEQRARRKQQALFDLQNGDISFEQFLAIDHPDTDAQLEELLYDSALYIMDTASLSFLATIWQSKLYVDAGVYIPMTGDMLVPPALREMAPVGAGGMPPGGSGSGFKPSPTQAAAGGATAY